ncbi:MFS transporter [Glycomyces salinus]|uniref:MFS transporter n=1 Tax=Glycomyces salinus TaxID=980294 RepID=UPI0018EC1C43|nr:MFS transporter [Glycomyces salinus]
MTEILNAETPRPARRGIALAVLLVMQLMVILDGSIVTVALPTIQSDLGFTTSQLAWVVNAYLIAFAGLLLLSGRLGDLVGSAKVFQAGLALFTAASVLAALAPSPEVLIAGRFLQGVGAALSSAVILGMIVRLYPEPGEQAKAMGLYSFIGAGGSAIGLVSGGVITQAIGWEGVFWVNVPIGLAAIVVAPKVLARERGLGLKQGADVLSAALVTVGLSLGVYAIVAIAEPEVPGSRSALLGAVAAALIAVFLVRQAKAKTPLLPLRIFRNRRASAANAVVVVGFATGFGFQFMLALYLQRVLGLGALETGLAFLPAPLMIGVVSLFVAARMVARFGTRAVLAIGFTALALGMALLSRAPIEGDYFIDVLPISFLMGAGFGLALPTLVMTAMSGAAPDDQGVASGLNNTAQQAGGAIGLAVLATVAASMTAGRLEAGTGQVEALRDGYSLAFQVAGGFALLALVIALVFLGGPKRTEKEEPTREPATASA